MKKNKKLLIGVGVLLMVSGILYNLYANLQPLKVEADVLVASDYEDHVVEEGIVRAEMSRIIYAPEKEKVLSILVEDGQSVDVGEHLITLDTRELTYEVEVLKAQLESVKGQSLSEQEVVDTRDISIQEEVLKKAERTLAKKQEDYEGNKLLHESGALSNDALEESKKAYLDAVNTQKIEVYKLENLKSDQTLGDGKSKYYQGQIEQISLKIEQMEQRIDDLTIKSPIAGTVCGLNLKIGEQIQKDIKICDVIAPGQLMVEAYVDTKDGKRLKEGDPVMLEIPVQNGFRDLTATLRDIGTIAEEVISPLGLTEKKIKVTMDLPENSELIIGEKVDVKFTIFSKAEVTILPRDYVFPWQEGKAVWSVVDGKAVIHPVEPIYESSSKIIVASEGANLIVLIPPYDEEMEEGIKVQ